jgi:seryl-tRNA synthetase
MLLATIDFSKIISDLAPILSAAVTGIGTYFLTRNNNGDKLSQREYDYITQERNRIQVLINDEITQIRKDKDELRTELIEIRNKLTELEKVEDECQLKLCQAQVIITQLRDHNASNMS